MRQRYNYGNRPRKYVVIFLAIIYILIFQSLRLMNVGGQVMLLGTVSLSGILTSVLVGIALIMVAIEYEIGGKVAIALLAISTLVNLMGIIFGHNYAAIPGVCYNIVGIIALFFIRHNILKERKNALIDELTGISNRRHIIQYMDHLILGKKPFYAVHIDIDHFKYINDVRGHEFGDEILKELVAKWNKIDTKNTAIGRLGGDEFLLIVQKSKCNSIDAFATKYIAAIREWIEEKEISSLLLTASAGISTYPEDGKKSADILRKADMATAKAKLQGRNRCVRYEESFEESVLKETYIEGRIRDALNNDKFYMVYQPQYKIDSKELRGFEALIRMDCTDDKFLSPGDFIPVAEKSDLIVEIGEYVLKKTMVDFREIYAFRPDLTLSVNISAKQLISRDFVATVKKIIDETGFNPNNLEIEITEYCLVESADVAVIVINALKRYGIQIAMDDFGTGYSSLSYLSKLPIDLIKIDKSIVDTMEQGEIVKAIVSMGHALSCEIIAEGVEDENQIEILKDLNCDYVQGFLWGKPMKLKEAEQLL